ncbi:MAG: hypothetical protein KDK51_11075 [Deltaproteobacteria bacterium]|nr:hypothetical protein [Deltaproteobacteria bacterium]
MSVHAHIKKEKLGEMIIQAGIASPIDIDHALQAQQVFGGTLGTNLVEAGIIDDEALAVFLSKQTGIEKVEKAELANIEQSTLDLIPFQAAQQLSLIPLLIENSTLTVAMADPTDTRVIEKVQEKLGIKLYPKIAPEFTIHMALKKYYQIPLSPRISRLLHHQNQQQKENNTPLRRCLDQHISSGETVEFFFTSIQSLSAIPLASPIKDITSYTLTPELIFMFQQIDGVSTISDMIQMSVFGKLETLRALVYLHKIGFVFFDER